MELGLTVTRAANFAEWYQQLVTKCKLIEYYDVSGCYVLLPNAYSIWEQVQQHLDQQFKQRDVQNVYFPLFITKRNLEREASHIEGFTPEVAWVTRVGTDPEALAEPLAVRPTSECAIYSVLPNLIRSHQDLPLKYNQWCNVVRWEFKDPTPFIRSREFLWNEGHTCFATQAEALLEVQDIIRVYRDAYEKVLAVPVILGRKTESEKFAGAELTYTVESFIPQTGKGIQGATAHYLGTNFSRMFGIKFQDVDEIIKHVHQNSWGFTTRSIGVMLMTHSDDVGMILPPKVASIQLVIVPILFKGKESLVMDFVNQLASKLKQQWRVKVDDRNYNPGWKYNYWEMMGVPLRLEVGPRDVTQEQVILVRRDTMVKHIIKVDQLEITIEELLQEIQLQMYQRALTNLQDSLATPNTLAEFKSAIEDKKICSVTWCGRAECEEQIKQQTGAKSLCMPLESQFQREIQDETICVCGEKSSSTCLFGKGY